MEKQRSDLWIFWGLERSTEDHVCTVRGQVLREFDWLWQSLGWSEERLDQPCDQQVRPRSLLRLSVKSTPDIHTHTHKYCCHFSVRDATYCVAQMYKKAEHVVFVLSKDSCTEGNMWSDVLTSLARISQGQAPYVHCLHMSTFTRWYWGGKRNSVFQCNLMCFFLERFVISHSYMDKV